MKRILSCLVAILLTAMCGVAVAGCGGTTDSNTLVIWCQSSDLQNIATIYFKKEFPDANIDCTVYSTTDLQQKLDQAFSSGKGLPDVFAMEEAIVSKYANSGGLVDQTNLLTAAEKAATYSSMLDEGKGADGKIYGYAYQLCPGAFYYRTDIAKAVWPVKTLEEVDGMIGESWDSLLGAAAELKAYASKQVAGYPGTGTGVHGKTTPSTGVTLVPGNDSMSRMFFSQMSAPWVSNNKLTIDDVITGKNGTEPNLFGMTKEIVSKGYCNPGQTYTFDQSSFNGSVAVNNNFGFFLPSWGIMTTIQPQVMGHNTQVPDTAGLWRCAKAPVDFAYGGTWIGIPKKAGNVELAKKFAYYVATNEDFKREYALNTMNFVNSPKIMAELAAELPLTYGNGEANPYIMDNGDGTTGFTILNGQNHYGLLMEVAASFTGNKLSTFDAVCNNAAIVWANYYATGTNGAVSVDAAISNMKSNILSQSPGLQS